MPSSWLNVPHFPQEYEYSCVAACVRMVLAHYGDVRSEGELRSLLDSRPTGTPGPQRHARFRPYVRDLPAAV